MAYPTRATLVTASTVAALTDASATGQDGFWAGAKRAVESHCGQRFDSEDKTIKLGGDGGRRLPLPRRLSAFTVVATTGSSLDQTDVELTDERDALIVKASVLATGGGNWVERALRDHPGLTFPVGHGTISITGTWGWTALELPATPDTAIGLAMRLDMEDQALAKLHGLASTVRAQAKLGLREVSEGPLSARITPPDTLLSVEAQLLLEDYIWQSPPVVA